MCNGCNLKLTEEHDVHVFSMKDGGCEYFCNNCFSNKFTLKEPEDGQENAESNQEDSESRIDS
jgi:hypothetical protein